MIRHKSNGIERRAPFFGLLRAAAARKLRHRGLSGRLFKAWQRVRITPLAFVVHSDAFLLLAVCFNHRAVAFDDRQVEEAAALLTPDPQSRLMKSVHQFLNVTFTEPSTKVTRGCGIGNPLSSQGIRIGFVVSSQFEMFQAGASGEQVEGNVEHMIGFGIRHVKLKDGTAAIDAVRDAQLPNQSLRDANPPACYGLSLLRHFIVHGRNFSSIALESQK